MKGAVDFEIRLGLESLDLLLAGGEDGEGRCLHAAGSGDIEAAVAGVETGQRTGRVEADEPIRLGAALRGIGQRAHLLVAAQVFPGLHDGSGGHRPHPKALDRLVDAPELHDVAENQFALAGGVASVDYEINVLALRQLQHLFEARLGLLDGIELEFLGNCGKNVEIPSQFLAVWPHRHAQLHEGADGGGDDRRVVFEMDVAPGADLVELAEGFGKRLG